MKKVSVFFHSSFKLPCRNPAQKAAMELIQRFFKAVVEGEGEKAYKDCDRLDKFFRTGWPDNTFSAAAKAHRIEFFLSTEVFPGKKDEQHIVVAASFFERGKKAAGFGWKIYISPEEECWRARGIGVLEKIDQIWL